MMICVMVLVVSRWLVVFVVMMLNCSSRLLVWVCLVWMVMMVLIGDVVRCFSLIWVFMLVVFAGRGLVVVQVMVLY